MSLRGGSTHASERRRGNDGSEGRLDRYPAAARASRGAVRRQFRRRGAVAISLLAAALAVPLLPLDPLSVDHFARGLPPSVAAPFGTDLLGRDVLARTLAALAVSAQVGLAAAAISTAIALGLALAATFSRRPTASLAY